MTSPHFRIFPIAGAWGWMMLNADGRPKMQGVASTKREAAACVIRGVVKEQVAHLERANTTFQAAA